MTLDMRSAEAALAAAFMHAQHLKSSVNIVSCCLCCRYFSRQELCDLFTLDDPYTSKTQMQLEKMHSHHRKTDEELDKHISFLYSLSKLHWSCCKMVMKASFRILERIHLEDINFSFWVHTLFVLSFSLPCVLTVFNISLISYVQQVIWKSNIIIPVKVIVILFLTGIITQL